LDNNLQILGLARKAGLLAVGAEDVSTAARNGKARLVISANDASENALRRARTAAESGGSMYSVIPYNSFELGSVTGRGSPGTVAILDAGLAARFLRGLAEKDPEQYRKAAEDLSQKALARTKKPRHTLSGKRRMMQ